MRLSQQGRAAKQTMAAGTNQLGPTDNKRGTHRRETSPLRAFSLRVFHPTPQVRGPAARPAAALVDGQQRIVAASAEHQHQSRPWCYDDGSLHAQYMQLGFWPARAIPTPPIPGPLQIRIRLFLRAACGASLVPHTTRVRWGRGGRGYMKPGWRKDRSGRRTASSVAIAVMVGAVHDWFGRWPRSWWAGCCSR